MNRQRTALVFLLCAFTGCAANSQAPIERRPPSTAVPPTPPPPPKAGSDWSRVQIVAAGTEVRVRTLGLVSPGVLFPKTHFDCLFVYASDDEFVCTTIHKVFFFPIRREVHIARPDVTSVRLTRRDLSSVVGGTIGAGAGIGLTATIVATNGETDHSEDVIAYLLLGSLGAAIGSPIGRATDFMGGPTIYRAP